MLKVGESSLSGALSLLRQGNYVRARERLKSMRLDADDAGDRATFAAYEALAGYLTLEVSGEALAEATIKAFSQNEQPHAYPPHNLLAFVAEQAPHAHTPAIRALLVKESAVRRNLAESAYFWVGDEHAPEALALLIGHMQRGGLTSRAVLGAVRLAARIDKNTCRDAILLLADATPPDAVELLSSLTTACLEANVDLNALRGALLRQADSAPEAALPGLWFNVARIEERTGRLVAAIEKFERARRDPTLAEEADRAARRLRLRIDQEGMKELKPSKQRETAERLAALLAEEPALGSDAMIGDVIGVLIREQLLDPFDLLVDSLSAQYEGDVLQSSPHGGIVRAAIESLNAANLTVAVDLSKVSDLAGEAEAHATTLGDDGFVAAAYMVRRLAMLAASETVDAASKLTFYFDAVLTGRRDKAAGMLSDVSREYHDVLKNLRWPRGPRGEVWPYYALPAPRDAAAISNWPTISVVIPSFNQRAYVEETLLSLLNQNYPKLQIIVFDAESTDGTQGVLRRYEDRLDVLRIEPDRGQSDALNKGMALANGDLLHWLNTDDLLAPGALEAIAKEYAETQSDILAGFCLEFSGRRFRLLNLPQADEADFTADKICNVFDRWMRGDYFYQPEVFFSRSIWEKTGAYLLVDANFTMDFEFWVRCADAGASYRRLHAPIAFFRKHIEQKTHALSDCIDEQTAFVAGRGFSEADEDAKSRVSSRLQRFRAGRKRVAVVSKRYGKIFSAQTEYDIAKLNDRYHVSFYEHPKFVDTRETDLIVNLCHVLADYNDVKNYRDQGFDGAILGWFWDNHHNYMENARTAKTLDFICPSHLMFREYLQNPAAVMMETVPLCVTQWTIGEGQQYFREYGARDRSDLLYGGFVIYDMAPQRNKLLRELMMLSNRENALSQLSASDLSVYFGKSLSERFSDWSNYKTSLCLPLRRDLSQRFFDAWLTGQVPVAPLDIRPTLEFLGDDVLLDHVAFFDQYTAGAVYAAHEAALEKFDRHGLVGVQHRHEMAVNKHMFVHRIESMLSLVEETHLSS